MRVVEQIEQQRPQQLRFAPDDRLLHIALQALLLPASRYSQLFCTEAASAPVCTREKEGSLRSSANRSSSANDIRSRRFPSV